MIVLLGAVACQDRSADNTQLKEAEVTTAPTGEATTRPTTSPAAEEEKDPAFVEYEITDVTLEQGERIVGVYPQVNGLLDTDLQNKINKVIQEDTMQFIDFFKQGDVTIELSYDVPWKGSRMLSLRYYMYYYSDGAAHPNNNYMTLNIDLINGKRVRLSDIVTIDDNFAKTMREYSTYTGPLESSAEIEEFMSDNLSVQDATAFSHADYSTDYYGMYTYFTENTIGFNLAVPHAIGDYALYEVNLANIKDYIKKDLPIWEDFKEALSGKPSERKEPTSSSESTVGTDEANGDAADLSESLCAGNEEVLIGFPLMDSEKHLAICIEKDNQDYIVYRFGTKDNVELTFPKTATDSWSQFSYSFYLRGGGTENEGLDLNYLTYENNGFRYQIYQEYSADSKATEVGILVTDLASGKETKLEGVSEEAEGDLMKLRDNDKIIIDNE
jgi:hypothetical protein